MQPFFRQLALFVLCSLFLPLTPASAARYQTDITCSQMSKLPPQAAGMMAFWLPGWWSARHNDPGVNAYRVTQLVQHLGNVCVSSKSDPYILATVRQFKDMPAVPDNGLTYSCRNFLQADAQWQTILAMWLQGYVAGETGDTFMDDGHEAIIASYAAQCRRDPNQTMGQVARTVGKRAR